MLKDDKLNVFNFQQRCCLDTVVTTDVKLWNAISTVTLRTVHEHITASVFGCFALRRAHQRSSFINNKHHKSDAFQVPIQLLWLLLCTNKSAVES